MIVAGIGCKAGTAAREIEAAIGAALSQAGLESGVQLDLDIVLDELIGGI